MLSREDRILSELLVSRGLVGREELENCARALVTARPGRSLVDALVDRGELDRDEGARAAEEAQAIDRTLDPDLPAVGRLGEFRLIREIGRGGMGIVYEAEQESLARRVAVKVLPAGAALDERLAVRFLREARTVGRLHHPGIVPVYASGRAEGVLFFAMEMIEGVSLAEAVGKGQVTFTEAARIAAAVARALHYAHSSGLVHRDIKPENILLGQDGEPRITDFGLVHDLTGATLTLAHHVLGTPAFIAPEQALGNAVDPRSDVYSLGAVLYTMLCGHPPYLGDVPSAVLGRVLAGAPPPVASLRADVPAELAAICDRAMARAPDDRYPTALAMSEDLERFLRGERVHADTVRAVVSPPDEGRLLFGQPAWRAIGVASIAVVAGSIALVPLLRRDGPSPSTPRQGLHAVFTPLVHGRGSIASPSWSPDGRTLAYASRVGGKWDVYLEKPGQGPAVNYTSDLPGGSRTPVFSPDGLTLAFQHGDTEVKGILLRDLASRKDRKLTEFGAGPSWSPNGHEIVYAEVGPEHVARTSTSKLWVATVASGSVRLLSGMEGSSPAYSPHGSTIAFVSQAREQTAIWTIPANGGAAARITDAAASDWSPVWDSDGAHLYFGSDRSGSNSLWRVRIDEGSGRSLGPPEPVCDTVFAAPFYLAFSREGRLALVSDIHGGRLHRMILDPDMTQIIGVPEALKGHIPDASSPDLSPDGRLLAFRASAHNENIAVVPAGGSAQARLVTNDGFSDTEPRWSPDGARIAFRSNRDGGSGIWSIGRDGSGLELIAACNGAEPSSPVWSPDGTRLAFSVARLGARVALLDKQGRPARIEELPRVQGSSSEFEPWSWSPGGDQIAGTAGGIVVYSLTDRTYQRLTDFGRRPTWLAGQRRLLFTNDRKLYLLDTRTRESKVLYDATPNELFPGVAVAKDGRTIYAALRGSPDEIWEVAIRE